MPLPHLTGANALLAYMALVIGVGSPGPSVLAVMGTAMAQGARGAGHGGGGAGNGRLCAHLCTRRGTPTAPASAG